MRYRRALSGALLPVLAGAVLVGIPAAPAAADEVYPAPAGGGQWVLYGQGRGLGQGLSEYGARKRAASGQTPGQILDFYYPATTGGTLDDGSTVRVSLFLLNGGFSIAGAPNLAIRDDTTGIDTPLPDPAARYRARVFFGTTPNVVEQSIDGGQTWTPVQLTPGSSSSGPLTFHGPPFLRAYPGAVPGTSRGYPGTITVTASHYNINTVSMRDYLAGVLAQAGADASWPPAALRAFAIAVRSYAGYLRSVRAGEPFDACDIGFNACFFNHDYLGRYRYDSTGERTDLVPQAVFDAITATAGQVRRYGDRPIYGEFGESNGGWTATNMFFPYLVARQDTFDPAGNPATTWQLSVPSTQLGMPFGADQLVVAHRDGRGRWGGRITELRAITGGTVAWTGGTDYLWLDQLDIPSADFVIVSNYRPVATPAGVAIDGSAGSQQDVFATGPTGEIWHRRSNGASGWLSWDPLGGALKGSPTALRMPDHGARVFIRGANDQLYTDYVDGTDPAQGTWHGWQRLGGALSSRPYPALLPDGSILLFYRRSDGAVGYATYRAGAVRGWTSLGGRISGAPAAAATGSGRVTVVARGAGGGIYARSLAAGRWGPWLALGGDTAGDLAAASPAPGVADVYLRGSASPHPLYTRRATSGRWGPWVNLGGSLATGPFAGAIGGRTTVWVLGAQATAYLRQHTSTSWGPWIVFP